jgi:hypothetical protein
MAGGRVPEACAGNACLHDSHAVLHAILASLFTLSQDVSLQCVLLARSRSTLCRPPERYQEHGAWCLVPAQVAATVWRGAGREPGSNRRASMRLNEPSFSDGAVQATDIESYSAVVVLLF